jgi:hypothetical protein
MRRQEEAKGCGTENWICKEKYPAVTCEQAMKVREYPKLQK